MTTTTLHPVAGDDPEKRPVTQRSLNDDVLRMIAIPGKVWWIIFLLDLTVLAVALAAVNVFGGFLVTRRMLEMFKKKDKKAPTAPAAGAAEKGNAA